MTAIARPFDPMSMDDHVAILRRVGWVLIILGAAYFVRTLYMLWRAPGHIELEVLLVPAGILLERGNLRVVRLMTWLSAFGLAAIIVGTVVVAPWVRPLDYQWWHFRRDPLDFFGGVFSTFLTLWVSFWVYKRLRSPPVLAAMVAAGRSAKTVKSAFIAGVAIPLVIGGLVIGAVHGKAADHAKALAAQEYGDRFKYFVTNINWGPHGVSATVIAYDKFEEKQTRVEW
jgi:hypothetical protein